MDNYSRGSFEHRLHKVHKIEWAGSTWSTPGFISDQLLSGDTMSTFIRRF